MKKQIEKIANEILKEAVDKTRKTKIKVSLDRQSSALVQKTIRSIPGFSNFPGPFSASINLDVIINLETTNERTFKNDLEKKLSRLRNLRFEII